jgi:hypothetical protein
MGQNAAVTGFIPVLQGDPTILQYARNIATSIVSGPANHCAATLSSLLVFVGIYPNGGGTGQGDLEPLVVNLAFDLENRRGWSRIDLGNPIEQGDVGVVIASATVHHIYLVMDAADQANPVVADNQAPSFHPRPVAGDGANYSPTSYFLRSPV